MIHSVHFPGDSIQNGQFADEGKTPFLPHTIPNIKDESPLSLNEQRVLVEIAAPPPVALPLRVALGHKGDDGPVQQIQVGHLARLPVIYAVVAFRRQATIRQLGILPRIVNLIIISPPAEKTFSQRKENQRKQNDA